MENTGWLIVNKNVRRDRSFHGERDLLDSTTNLCQTDSDTGDEVTELFLAEGQRDLASAHLSQRSWFLFQTGANTVSPPESITPSIQEN